MGFLDPVLAFFKFSRGTDLVAAVCFVLLLFSFSGGLLAALAKAFGGPKKPKKFGETWGWRIVLVFEIALAGVAFFYYFRGVGKFVPMQAVFWVTSALCIPVLWYIGSTITQLIFWSKISKNEKAYRKMVADKKFAKHKKLRGEIQESTKETRAAKKSREGVSAKGRKGHRAMVDRRKAKEG